jgi:hypothetical protein
MHFDDRLATVLRHRAAGERAGKTQFRQLIDLLGERPQAGDPALKAAAYLRLIALAEMIPVDERARIVGENGWRFRNPELVKWFGEAHPKIAAAALYRAHLTGEEWERLIPRLPIRARGFLRHRRDLPEAAMRVLDRLGVQDRALPLPDMLELLDEAEPDEQIDTDLPAGPSPLVLSAANDGDEASEDDKSALHLEGADDKVPAEPATAAHPTPAGTGGIRALVDRIEAYKRNRGSGGGEALSLPLGEPEPAVKRKPVASFLFGTDAEGRIDWAEDDIAPMVVGTSLAQRRGDGAGGDEFAASFLNRRPVRGATLKLRGGEAIVGEWTVDAAPRFTRGEGRFYGYVGRFRRAVAAGENQRHESADRLRQLLHELRTPVNAMQGNAEVIQQQVFGPTPHEYRALAASIAGDSARILAGFDELDRLARLETGTLDLEPGTADFAAIAHAQIDQLQSVLKPRIASFATQLEADAALLPITTGDAEMLAWRVLATIAGATGAGETIKLSLRTEDGQATLRAQLPATLASAGDVFSHEARSGAGAVSAGIFGAGFSLRLARAEARAARGELSRDDQWLVLSLPLLTGEETLPSPIDAPGRAAG